MAGKVALFPKLHFFSQYRSMVNCKTINNSRYATVMAVIFIHALQKGIVDWRNRHLKFLVTQNEGTEKVFWPLLILTTPYIMDSF